MNQQKRSTRNSFMKNFSFDRNIVFFVLIIMITIIIIARLFYLQVLAHNYYARIATREHYGYNELPAHRGEIFIKDYASGNKVRVATNSTLDLLYADPTLIKNKKLVADRLTPLLYNLEEERKTDDLRVKTSILRAQTAEDLEKIKPYTDDELYKNYYDNILEKISSDIRPVIILTNDLSKDQAETIHELNLTGVEVTENNQLKVYPPKIQNIKLVSQTLGKALEVAPLQLETTLKGRNRYVVLKKKISQDISSKIKQLIHEDKSHSFTGLGLKEEYYRYYPEGQLAANVLGFVNNTGNGTYGIEEKFNHELKGKNGVFETQKDSIGRLITVGNTLIQPAQDGKDIVLTIDRAVQMAVEAKLERAVKKYRADSGQVVVMDPKSGRIIALAYYPSFDPNNYGTVYETEEVKLNEQEIKDLIPIKNRENTYWLYRNFTAQDRTMIFKETLKDGTDIYSHYKNNIGPEAYQNKIVTLPYEPGSVFKIITMAIGIDDGDITPSTTITDSGILKVDEFEIKNVSKKCTGRLNMSKVLAYSCNTGMGYVAQKIGRNLFYNYLKRFGFGERTEIEFDNENTGKLEHYSQWADSELVTHAFGQGLTVTPIQMVTAISTIANHGVMMQPYIVDQIQKNPDEWVTTKPTTLGQIIHPETAKTITNMMIGAVENGVSNGNKMDNHYVAAKTGTSQTYRHGKPLKGVGTTIASVGGFGPVDDPRFVILAKLDKPRSSEWANNTTSFLFKDIAEYLFEYYSIPPDK